MNGKSGVLNRNHSSCEARRRFGLAREDVVVVVVMESVPSLKYDERGVLLEEHKVRASDFLRKHEAICRFVKRQFDGPIIAKARIEAGSRRKQWPKLRLGSSPPFGARLISCDLRREVHRDMALLHGWEPWAQIAWKGSDTDVWVKFTARTLFPSDLLCLKLLGKDNALGLIPSDPRRGVDALRDFGDLLRSRARGLFKTFGYQAEDVTIQISSGGRFDKRFARELIYLLDIHPSDAKPLLKRLHAELSDLLIAEKISGYWGRVEVRGDSIVLNAKPGMAA